MSLMVLALTACNTQQRSPDEIRRETAAATSTATRDAKAVAQGVADGLKHGGAVNINNATDTQLETLPDIDEASAHRIIDNRPYGDSYELVKKHAITKTQYDHIADKITVK